MSLRVQYAPWFDADVHFRTAWYAEQGGIELAERFVSAVEATIRRLIENPCIGRRPYPKDSELAELRCVLVELPFRKHFLFYRFADDALFLERLIHGARDLPRRLQESPYRVD